MNYEKSIKALCNRSSASKRSSGPQPGKALEAKMHLLGRIFLGIAAITALAGNATALHAASLKTLHQFPTSGAYRPYAALVQDPVSGNVYGTTFFGSAPDGFCTRQKPDGCGNVFEMTPPAPGETKWSYKEIYGFGGPPNDGGGPVGALIFDNDGNLYGVTQHGGDSTACDTSGSEGCGTVYELSPPLPGKTKWKERILYSFSDGTDGAVPDAGLVFDGTGNLFGTTVLAAGGTVTPSGTVFELLAPQRGSSWRLKTLHQFCLNGQADCRDGSSPMGKLVFDSVGNLYGTTNGGGATGTGGGSVFELSPPAPGKKKWKEKLLYSFAFGGDYGDLPVSGLTFVNGTLYGTTSDNGGDQSGIVFGLVPGDAQPTQICAFPSPAQPETPSGLAFDGDRLLYGTTSSGGTAGYGSVFSCNDKNGSLQTLHSFDGSDGYLPVDGLIFDVLSGSLLGTTAFGGAAFAQSAPGTVFEQPLN